MSEVIIYSIRIPCQCVGKWGITKGNARYDRLDSFSQGAVSLLIRYMENFKGKEELAAPCCLMGNFNYGSEVKG